MSVWIRKRWAPSSKFQLMGPLSWEAKAPCTLLGPNDKMSGAAAVQIALINFDMMTPKGL